MHALHATLALLAIGPQDGKKVEALICDIMTDTFTYDNNKKTLL